MLTKLMPFTFGEWFCFCPTLFLQSRDDFEILTRQFYAYLFLFYSIYCLPISFSLGFTIFFSCQLLAFMVILNRMERRDNGIGKMLNPLITAGEISKTRMVQQRAHPKKITVVPCFPMNFGYFVRGFFSFQFFNVFTTRSLLFGRCSFIPHCVFFFPFYKKFIILGTALCRSYETKMAIFPSLCLHNFVAILFF